MQKYSLIFAVAVTLLVLSKNSYAMFDPNAAPTVGREAAEELSKGLENIGSNAAKQFSQILKTLTEKPVRSEFAVRVEIDEKVFTGLKVLCKYAAGLTITTTGVVLIADGARRIAEKNGEKILYKLFEIATGAVITSGGLFIILR